VSGGCPYGIERSPHLRYSSSLLLTVGALLAGCCGPEDGGPMAPRLLRRNQPKKLQARSLRQEARTASPRLTNSVAEVGVAEINESSIHASQVICQALPLPRSKAARS
jgi:hypothetical protein